MAENPTERPESPDVRTIRHLVRLMKRYDLTAIDIREGATQIRLRRRGVEVAMVPVLAAPPVQSVAPPAASPPPPAAAAPGA